MKLDPHLSNFDPRFLSAAERGSSDPETFGRLLAHLIACPKCSKQIRKADQKA